MKLFEKNNLGNIELSNRVIMAPLTRRRCTRENVPVEIMSTYYAQRAGAGLIIAEGTSPSPNGVGYANMPGLFNKEQAEQWRKVVDAVHEENGKIFLQVMHTGRVSHSNNLPSGANVLAPSNVKMPGQVSTYNHGKQDYSVPQEMTLADISTAVEEFRSCAKLAVEVGFDGIELHGAHGYLPNQFINKSTNKRKDKYGGSNLNRLRFLLDIIDATTSEIGGEKVGLRISPFSYADVNEQTDDLNRVYKLLIEQLNTRNMVYLHLSHMGEASKSKFDLWDEIRNDYRGTLMICGDFTKETAEEALVNNKADLIAFGRDFIANPDLVERFKNDWPLEERNRDYWYTLGAKGLIDYENYK